MDAVELGLQIFNDCIWNIERNTKQMQKMLFEINSLPRQYTMCGCKTQEHWTALLSYLRKISLPPVQYTVVSVFLSK